MQRGEGDQASCSKGEARREAGCSEEREIRLAAARERPEGRQGAARRGRSEQLQQERGQKGARPQYLGLSTYPRDHHGT